ncbi:MAG: NTP transferase domain-containing protein [Mariprofundaceae bacterium]
MKALIIAAGRGSRLQQKEAVKPLVPLSGIPLIERVILAAREAGVDDFTVVTGYCADAVVVFLDSLSARLGLPITTVHNEQWDSRENGMSVLAARNQFDSPFLLTMTDHIFDPAMLSPLLQTSLTKGEIALAVDGDTANPFADMADVTRVRTETGRVTAIGKGLDTFNGFDTGAFLAVPALFDAIVESMVDGDSSLSGGVRLLAGRGCVRAVDVSGHFWVDVDDPISFWRAENALLAHFGDTPYGVPS